MSPIDPEIYFALKRAFRYLAKHFRLRRQTDLAFDLHVFAFGKIGLCRSRKDAGQIKKELQAGLAELESIGFLKTMPREERYVQAARGKWTIRLSKAAAILPSSLPSPALLLEKSDAHPPLVRELIARGVTATAETLARDHPAPEIEAKLEVFDWLASKQERLVSKNPGEFLAESIRKAYAAPRDFAKKAGQARRIADDESKRRGAEEILRRNDEEARSRDEARQSRVSSYWGALSPAEQALCREDALRKTTPFLAGQYRKHHGKGSGAEAFYLEAIIHDHIHHMIYEDDGV